MSSTWFITGINSGFGRHMSEQLLSRGHRVFGTVRDADGVRDLKAAYGDALHIARLDLSDISAIPALVDGAFAALGRIDVVVNNAGYGLFGPAEGLSDQQIRHQIDTNLVGPIHVARAALPHLRRQGGGHLLAMSSYGGQATHPGASLYHASKWGMEGFFESLAAEVAPFNIKVTIVEPGGARTAFRNTAGARLGDIPDAYRDLPLAAMLGRLSDPAFVAGGDPARMAARIIDSVGQAGAEGRAERLILGSDAYAMLHKALAGRLAVIESQREAAASTDFG